jgi:hypothetical protein
VLHRFFPSAPNRIVTNDPKICRKRYAATETPTISIKFLSAARTGRKISRQAAVAARRNRRYVMSHLSRFLDEFAKAAAGRPLSRRKKCCRSKA